MKIVVTGKKNFSKFFLRKNFPEEERSEHLFPLTFTKMFSTNENSSSNLHHKSTPNLSLLLFSHVKHEHNEQSLTFLIQMDVQAWSTSIAFEHHCVFKSKIIIRSKEEKKQTIIHLSKRKDRVTCICF